MKLSEQLHANPDARVGSVAPSEKPKRFLVGVLRSGENEFEKCLTALRGQQGVEFDVFVIEDLPKHEAHKNLFASFMERSDEYDYFLKLDADMVLLQPDLLSRVAACFDSHPAVGQFSIKVYDWFTQRDILGMHTWRSDVRWPEQEDAVFTDRLPKSWKWVVDEGEFRGAVSHAGDPSPFQAFRFGVHKAWKARTGLSRGRSWRKSALGHFRNIERLWKHQQINPDERLTWACLGAELMLSERWPLAGFDYSGEAVCEEFRYWSSAGDMDRLEHAKRLRWRNRYVKYWRLRHFALATEYRLCDPVLRFMKRIGRRLRVSPARLRAACCSSQQNPPSIN